MRRDSTPSALPAWSAAATCDFLYRVNDFAASRNSAALSVFSQLKNSYVLPLLSLRLNGLRPKWP